MSIATTNQKRSFLFQIRFGTCGDTVDTVGRIVVLVDAPEDPVRAEQGRLEGGFIQAITFSFIWLFAIENRGIVDRIKIGDIRPQSANVYLYKRTFSNC